ncbi:MAG: AAA family ATPase [Candidatus Geothermincolia bacterium]
MPLTVAFHGAKGGVGTSMLTAEAATILARGRRNILAVDADLERGTLHYRLDLPLRSGTFVIGDVLGVLDDISGDLLQNAVSRCPCGAALLPAAVGRPGRPDPDEGDAVALVDALSGHFDRVLIDTKPSGEPFTRGLLAASDVVVLVVTPELACLGSARRALELLNARGGKKPAIMLAVNRSMSSHDVVTRDDIESFLGLRVSAFLPEDTARCRRLGDGCKPITSERSALASALLGLIKLLP